MNFDYILENYKLYGEPILITEMLKNLDSDKNMSEIDKKEFKEEYEGYNKNFYMTWAVHNINEWTGYLILDKSRCKETDNEYIIATGVAY